MTTQNGFGVNDMRFVANDTALAETLAEAQAMARSRALWGGLVGLAVIVGATGPFGTYTTMPMPGRLGSWALVVVATFWMGYLSSFATVTAAEARGLAPRVSSALGVVVASLVIAFWLAGLHVVLLDDAYWPEARRLFPYIVISVGFVAALEEWRDRRTTPSQGRHIPAR